MIEYFFEFALSLSMEINFIITVSTEHAET